MNGRRARPHEVLELREKCRKLFEEGINPKQIGVLVGLERTTVLWHLGKINPEKFKDNINYVKKWRKDVKTGVRKPCKKVFVEIGWGITQLEEAYAKNPMARGQGCKDRVKGLDGKYYYWCSECLFKTPWKEYKKTGKCDFCEKKMVQAVGDAPTEPRRTTDLQSAPPL